MVKACRPIHGPVMELGLESGLELAPGPGPGSGLGSGLGSGSSDPDHGPLMGLGMPFCLNGVFTSPGVGLIETKWGCG